MDAVGAVRATRRSDADGGVGASFTLGALLNAFRRHWKIFLAVALTVALLVIGATFFVKPRFTATARLRLDPDTRSVLATDAVQRGVPPDQAMVDTEIAVMHSRNNAAAVAKTLDLAALPQFSGDADQVAEKTLGAVRVMREGSTYVVSLTADSADPDLAAKLADAFADQYLVSSADTRTAAAKQQSQVLNQRLGSLGSDARAADEQVAQYRARTGITSAAGQLGTINDQQIAPLTSQLATAQSDAAAARSTLQAARAQIAGGDLQAVSGVLNSSVIGDLRRQRTEVMRNQAEISSRYGPLYPESIKVAQQLQQIDRQLREESQRIISSLDATARAADARAGSLRGDLDGLKRQQASDARASVQADSLQRQADAKRAVYNQVAQSAQQTGQEQHINDPHARIIESATPPSTPSFPNRTLFALLGALLGGLLGACVVMLLELTDNGLRSVDDVERRLDAPLLASIPLLSGGQLKAQGRKILAWDYVLAKPMSGYAEAIRTIRSALLLSPDGVPVKVIVVTSAVPGEGKSTCAVSLARIMAMSGSRVALVDCDLRRNALQSLAPASEQGGLLEVLNGSVSLDEALVKDSVDGLDVLLLRKASFTPRDVLGSDAMGALIRTLAERYDAVILDGPPVLAVSDARTLAARADAVLMVSRWNKTPRQGVRAALDRLEDDGARVAGVVLSQVDLRAPGAVGEGDAGYYYGAYQSYYKD